MTPKLRTFFLVLTFLFLSTRAFPGTETEDERANVFDFGISLGAPAGFTLTFQSWKVAGSDVLLRASLGYFFLLGGVSAGAGYIVQDERDVRQYLIASVWHLAVGTDEPSSGNVGFLEYGFQWNAVSLELGIGLRISGDVGRWWPGFRFGVVL